MEFAFVAPVLVVLLLAVYEICNATLIFEEVQNAAHSIPASASNLALGNAALKPNGVDDGTTLLTYAQTQLAESEIWAEIPELRSGFQNGTKSITLTSVTFLPTYPASGYTTTCVPEQSPKVVTCKYTPTVVWSVAYAGGDSGRTFQDNATGANAVARSCTGAPTQQGQANATVIVGTTPETVPGGLNNEYPPTITQAPTWHAVDLTSLPTFLVADPDPYLAPPSPVLVVDIHLKYTPILGLFLNNGIDFYGTGFFPVRSVKTAILTTSGTTTTVSANSLSAEFTTIYNDATDESNGTLLGAPNGTYCINNSPYLTPAANST
jgi:hypothetical protein